ncbi:TetR/AcrR family transcriptional regulator [Cohnella lupini]|uniref:TetR family transcriptional regulator n=1 Tax=Cohnella lupini TaxID=1294267 RepID=A0A3D9ICC3_9BACL|nr:TetR/AcrR family transcriptional regulator [Cohnella lupini]RED59331.1 TetR family transcriptional regulator [Cohnella lupini]
MECELDQKEEKRKSIRDKLVLKLLPYIQRNGIVLLKMDDVAKYMDISKATMYKYFVSKDEIIECLVEQCVNYTNTQTLEEAPQKLTLEQLSHPSHEDRMNFGETFAKAFKLSVKMAFFLTDIFLQDLKAAYPDLYAKLSEAVEQCQRKLIAYLNSGMELGVFHRMNSGILLIQLDVVLRKLLDPNLLMLHDMTLKQALLDFYEAIKHQTFNEKWIHEDQSGIESFINQMVIKKLSHD